MRVLAVSTWYPTAGSPVTGVFVQRGLRALAERHEVALLHLTRYARRSSAAEDWDGNVLVRRSGFNVRRPDQWVTARRAIDKAIDEFRPDVLHTMVFSTLIPLSWGRPQVPWIHTEHWSGVSNPASVGPFWRAAAGSRRLLERPQLVTAVSQHLAATIRTARRGPIHVVPNVVSAPSTLQPRRQLDDGPNLICVGGLVPGKDPLTAVATVEELHSRGLRARLSWVGDGPLRARTMAAAERANLADVIELAGRLPQNEVSARLSGADIFMLPTLGETFCISAAEALAHGRPVVVGANGGQREFIDDGVGRLVEVQEANAYADAIQDVMRHLGGTSAHDLAATVKDRFSAKAVRLGYESAYASASDLWGS